MLITEKVIMRWNGANRKWFESKGYIYTKKSDLFEVKVEELSNSSSALVNIKCDECKKTLKNIPWDRYTKHIHGDGKYYCNACAHKLFVGNLIHETRLKNGLSFEEWCINNNRQDILDRWDYIKNNCKPNEVTFSSQGKDNKGYWFKCLKNSEHKSELKNISNFTSGHEGSILCSQCNSIFQTHPYLVKYFVNIEDTKKNSIGSGNKVLIKCPDCGYIKSKNIYDFINKGFGCNRCSDGVSFPEKFFFNVLEQLNIDFNTQLNKSILKWCENYKYDFYIPNIGIIETHGIQHYEERVGKSKFTKTLEEEQNNDKLKEKLAKENNIKNYIVIDCRKSELEFIKNNILHSELPQLLNFKEFDIDWLKCHEFACKSLVKVACDMWNEGINNIIKISEELKIGKNAIRKYLKQGAILGWCNYNAKEETIKNYSSERGYRKIVCLNTGEIFKNLLEGAEKYDIKSTSSISACCIGKRKYSGKDPITGWKLVWMYYEDYVIKNKTLGYINDFVENCQNRVICLTTETIFNSQLEASQIFNMDRRGISSCCLGKVKSAGKHPVTGEPLTWMYYEEYLKLKENELNTAI